MKFTLLPVLLTVAIASVAQAQIPFAGSLLKSGAKAVGNRAYNRLFGTTTPALPEGYMGTRVANAMTEYIPGAKRLAPRSIRANGEFMNSLEDDMQRIGEGIINFDVTGLPRQTAESITNAVDSIRNAMPQVYGGFGNLVNDIISGNVGSLMELPGRIAQTTIVDGLGQLVSSLWTLIMNGIPMNTLVPTSLSKLLAIPSAIFADVRSSPGAFAKLAMKAMAPAPIAALL